VNEKDLKILNVLFSYGSIHDLKLLYESKLYFSKDVLLIADKGYLGINKIYSNSLISKKSTKKGKLTKEEKKYNSIFRSGKFT
jgi:probable transposase for insertion sequence element IS702